MQVLALACYSLQKAIYEMDNSSLVMERDVALEVSESLFRFIRAYTWLGSHYFGLRRLMFRIRPKLHYIYHQAVEIRDTQLNLCCFHTFSEESFLGKIKTLAKACHGRTMCKQVFARYLLVLALMVDRQDRLEAVAA